jgi:hypothetical protein
MPVVVLDVDPKGLLEMAAPDDQQPVQTVTADGADPAFRIRVRLGRLYWCHQHLGTLGAEHVVEASGELRVTVTDQEAQLSSLLTKRQQQVAGLLGDQPRTGC